MLNITFEINGKPVSPDNLQDVMMAAVLEGVKDYIIEKAGSVTCLQHGGSPSIAVSGANLEDLSFHVNGCCQGLIDEVKSKFEE